MSAQNRKPIGGKLPIENNLTEKQRKELGEIAERLKRGRIDEQELPTNRDLPMTKRLTEPHER